jgi:hypothetical protein
VKIRAFFGALAEHFWVYCVSRTNSVSTLDTEIDGERDGEAGVFLN